MKGRARLSGAKPHFVAELLGVSVDTLGYWRKQLAPVLNGSAKKPKRLHPTDLFAFRIIRELVERKYSIASIKQTPGLVALLFDLLRDQNYSNLRDSVLVIDMGESCGLVCTEQLSKPNHFHLYICLSKLVDEQHRALHEWHGHVPVNVTPITASGRR